MDLMRVLCLPKTPSVEIAGELPNRGMILSHAEDGCAGIEVAGIAREAATAAPGKNLVLRHQLNILRRQVCGRIRMSNADRLAFVCLYRLCPAVIDVVTIIRPETPIRWHQCGFKVF